MSQAHPVERELRQMLREINIREISVEPNAMQKAVDILRIAQAGGMTQVTLLTEDVIEAGSRAGVYIPLMPKPSKPSSVKRGKFLAFAFAAFMLLAFLSLLNEVKGLRAQQEVDLTEKKELELALSIARSK